MTWTLTRDAGTDVRFTGVVLYDEQRFMTWRKLGSTDLRTIGAATVCVIGATTSEQNLLDFLGIEHLPLRPKVVQSTEGLYDALVGHQCDLISSDHVALATYRQLRAGDPEDFVLLPETISREPIGPLVSITDPRWLDIVKWTVFALIVAEEHGVTQANLGTLLTTATDGETRRLLGIEPGMGAKLGLDARWATRAIREVGNYGEIFERHLDRRRAPLSPADALSRRPGTRS
jgi:general L-amino acid transport system substrate-binding protein